MKALIKVGYACNEHCSFCHTLDIRHLDDTSERIHLKIERARRLGHSMVVFSGGEPTIRPEIGAWAAHVASLGLDLGFVTNGRRFAYPEFVDAMLACRLRYAYVSFHGPSARVHNSLVRAPAFDETLQAIRNLHTKIEVLTVNCVVTRSNLAELRALVDLLLPLPHLTLKFSMTAPKGGGDRLFEHLVPPVTDVARAVADAISYGLARRGDATGPHFGHDGLPLCLLPGLEHLYDDLRTNAFRTMTEVGEDDFFPVDDVIKVQPDDPCAGCSLRGPCPGLFRGYLDRFPDGARALTPRPGGRANSYNLTPRRDLPRPPGAPCPLPADGTSSYDRGRSLFVRLPDRMRLFETRTRDLSDAELLTTKEERGQLYLDVSRKLAPDDFSRDLRKLRVSDECRSCELRPRCPGAWSPVPVDVFRRDDARVHELLAALAGDVLDIGAGEGSYLATLAPRVTSGAVRYTALEPHPDRAALLTRRHPWARTLVAPAESLDLPPASLDHALLLRSYNHLADPAPVLAALARALRPGGSLLVVDNVAFGLVRSSEHAARAESGPATHEHHRNDDDVAAHRLTSGLPLTLRERHAVGPDTSNQWMLRYERVATPASG